MDPDGRREMGLALLAGIAGVAGSFAITGGTTAFILAPIDTLVVNLAPGLVVAWLIDTVGAPAHVLHLGIAGLIAVGLLGAGARAGLRVASLERPVLGTVFAGGLAWATTWAITGQPVTSFGAAVPVTVSVGIGVVPSAGLDSGPARRRVLMAGIGAVGAVGLMSVIDRLRPSPDPIPADTTIPGGDDPELEQLLRDADEKSLDITGDDMPGLVSEIGDFYNVDIASFDPQLDAESWSMEISGEVKRSVTVDFEALTAMPIEHRHTTLRCVGEPLNGRQLDNAVWTGTPIETLLDRAGPSSACNCVMLHGDDGYFVQFPVEALEDGFLAWGMNGRPLPRSHGHPVRVLVPGHWGETNVKWLEEIEFLDEAVNGYWEERGWVGTGQVGTVAKLWSVQDRPDGRTEVAGHAYAGTRGISRVEVSVDDGQTWNDATLSDPLPGSDVWRQWRYRYESSETSEVVVRAVDGDGQRQPRVRSDSFPAGATGWVSRRV